MNSLDSCLYFQGSPHTKARSGKRVGMHQSVFYDIRLYQVSLESYHMRHPMEYKYNLRKAHAIIGITKTSDRKETKSKWQLKGS